MLTLPCFAQNKNEQVWLLTYFRQRYPTRVEVDKNGKIYEVPLPDPMNIENLHMALSTDGRHWTALNNNKPVWNRQMRDPFLHRGPDGLWRIMATGNDGNKENRQKYGPACLFASSADLVNWKVENYLHLMKDIKDETGAPAGNIWAPEFYYDEETKEYVLFWSSSFKDAGWKQSKLWYCKTRDWKTFTPAKVLFAPPYSVIDGTLTKYNGIYYLVHKEEEFGAKTGERRGIRLATSTNIEGPYKIYSGDLNNGQIAPTITEGPSVMPDPLKQGWLLLYDYPMADKYGISSSPDLKKWKIETNIAIPPDARHGSVSRITAEEAEILRRNFPEK
ncbi:MAG: 1,4-beta-xylanase [Sphingobacteriaceae bacterium]|nr:MAG: 1,4-beta-xylanase [Sphingobacteriaceae bacterium]